MLGTRASQTWGRTTLKRYLRSLGSAVVLTVLTAAAGVSASGAPVADTLTFSPPTPGVGHSIIYEGGSCAPGEDVVVTLSYAASGVAVARGTVIADAEGQFAGRMPMVGDASTVPVGTRFELRAECGTRGQTDPDRYVIATGVVGDPAEPTIEVMMSPDPVNPGGALTVEGVGCSAEETVTVATDDPAISAATRTADGYGGFWAVLVTNPSAPAGSTLDVTVTCGSAGTPPDVDRVWTGTVNYSGVPADPPRPMLDDVVTVEGRTVTIHPLDNDSGRDVTIVHVGSPAHGTAVISPDATTIDYTPDPEFIGVDTFTYAIENVDGVAGTSIRVTVEPAPSESPDAPESDESSDVDGEGDGDVDGASGAEGDENGSGDRSPEADRDGAGGNSDASPDSLPDTGTADRLGSVVVLAAAAIIGGAAAVAVRKAART